jgi:hypothetical protein
VRIQKIVKGILKERSVQAGDAFDGKSLETFWRSNLVLITTLMLLVEIYDTEIVLQAETKMQFHFCVLLQ